MNIMPKVTILIPAPDAGPAVMTTIHSAIRQTWDGLKIVVAAASAEVHRSLTAKMLGRRVWIVAPPAGKNALNHAMGHAVGQFILRLDPGYTLSVGALPRLLVAGLRGGVAIGPGEFVTAGGRTVRRCRVRGLLTASDYGKLLCAPPMLVERYRDRPYRDASESGALHDAEIVAVTNCVVAAEGPAVWQCRAQAPSRQDMRVTLNGLAAASRIILSSIHTPDDDYSLDEEERAVAARVLRYRHFVMKRYVDRLGFGSEQLFDQFVEDMSAFTRSAFDRDHPTGIATIGLAASAA